MSEKHLALHQQHLALGGRMVPFAGFIMPIQYTSIIEEHLAVRENVGIFDVSHMGEFEFRGADAESFLNRMTTNNVAKLEVGQVQYSAMLYDDGGVVDDLLVYRLADRFMTVVNAANIQKDWEWLKSHLSDGFGDPSYAKADVQMTDISDDITLLAIQGPRAAELVRQIAGVATDDIVYYHYREGKVGGVPAIISRTGYTGEDGFELYVKRADSVKLWDAIWAAGKPLNLKPVGLGCRDSLRLEACYCLYGNDIDATTNPMEAGLGWIVKAKKPGGFIGLEPVLKAKDGTGRQLAGFTLDDKSIARHGAEIYRDGVKIGVVTSGGYSPVLDKPVGMGYINKPHNEIGAKIQIDMRGRMLAARVAPTPFYKRV